MVTIAVGLTYTILRSWGFTGTDVALYVGVTGIWNIFVKLALPVLSVVILVISGERTSFEGSQEWVIVHHGRKRMTVPRVPAEDRSIGKAFTAPDGTVYRPSMFVTLTLGSYGRIVPGTGTPANPRRYDYRRAAAEALHFPRLFDRWMQNLRRCAGYRVQYFGAVEPQRRLANHNHSTDGA